MDIDGDGDLDALVGEGAGNINFLLNVGTSTTAIFNLSPDTAPFGLSDVGGFSVPSFADIDGDGDFDAFVGESDGNINFFINVGTSTAADFNLSSTTAPFGLSDIGGFSFLSFADIDSDGDLDAFVGEDDVTINFLNNGPCKSSHKINHVQLTQDLFMTNEELGSRAVINKGREATFSAATGITLDTLFEVRQSATFIGLMGGCPLE